MSSHLKVISNIFTYLVPILQMREFRIYRIYRKGASFTTTRSIQWYHVIALTEEKINFSNWCSLVKDGEWFAASGVCALITVRAQTVTPAVATARKVAERRGHDGSSFIVPHETSSHCGGHWNLIIADLPGAMLNLFKCAVNDSSIWKCVMKQAETQCLALGIRHVRVYGNLRCENPRFVFIST